MGMISGSTCKALQMAGLGFLCAAFITASQPVWAHCGSCGADAKEAHGNSITSVAKEAGDFNTLLKAAEAAGLVDTLSHEGPYTVFAPSDAAFEKLPDGTLEKLLENKGQLKKVLLYHVVQGTVPAEQALTLEKAPSALGQDIPFKKKQGNLFVAGAKVVATDIQADNGVIHVIDQVMMPRDIMGIANSNDSFTTLTAAIEAAGLDETLRGEGPFTVFAPTDAAFAKLPEGTVNDLLMPKNREKLRSILTAHVVTGAYSAEDVATMAEVRTVQGSTLPLKVCETSGVQVADSRVIDTDINAFNGVIHVIDAVILPTS